MSVLPEPVGALDEDVDVLVDGIQGLYLEAIESEGEAIDESTAVVVVAHFFNNLPMPIAKK